MTESIKTSSGSTFSGEDTRALAHQVFKRFGKNLADATAAWNRMLGNNCSESDFNKLITPETPFAVEMVCPACDSTNVARDALAEWSVEKQDWVLSTVLDSGCCNSCGEEDIKNFNQSAKSAA